MEKLVCIWTTILVLGISFGDTAALNTNNATSGWFSTSGPTTAATSDWTVSVRVNSSSIAHQETSTLGWTSISTTAATETLNTTTVRDNQTVRINIVKDAEGNHDNKEKGETTESKTEDAPKPLGGLLSVL